MREQTQRQVYNKNTQQLALYNYQLKQCLFNGNILTKREVTKRGSNDINITFINSIKFNDFKSLLSL